MRAWNWNVTDSKKKNFDLIIPQNMQKWQIKEMSHDFVRGQSVAETCFSHWGDPAAYQRDSLQSQRAVTAYLKDKRFLPFHFAQQNFRLEPNNALQSQKAVTASLRSKHSLSFICTAEFHTVS